MKTKIIFLFALLTVCNFVRSNADTTNNEITLIVSGNGSTKEEAIKTALRSAIEQTYGTFVSANTTILDDEIVRDEIVTVSSGNIKEYKEISSIILPNGIQQSTLQVTVNVNSLINYAESKGAECEFAGASFVFNIKQKKLNEKNEIIAVKNLIQTIKELFAEGWDYNIDIKNVNANGKINSTVTITPNQNAISAINILKSTLESLSLTKTEIDEYRSLEMPVYPLFILPHEVTIEKYRTSGIEPHMDPLFSPKAHYINPQKIYIRNEMTYALLKKFCTYDYVKSLFNFQIQTNDIKSKVVINQTETIIPFIYKNTHQYDHIKNENLSIIYRSRPIRLQLNDARHTFYITFPHNKGMGGKREHQMHEQWYTAEKDSLHYITEIINPENTFFYPSNISIENNQDRSSEKGDAIIFPSLESQDITVIMNIPLEELERISKFTIERNK